jgi:ketosteroid isomerase-like protein
MHCGTASRPKLHCELFDVDVKTFAASEDCRATSVAGRSAAPDAARGLCCNCENRKHCVIRAREGAIWHCEEYC